MGRPAAAAIAALYLSAAALLGGAAAPPAPASAAAPWTCAAAGGLAALVVDAASGAYSAPPFLDGGDVALHFGGPSGPWLSRSGGGLAPAAPGAASAGRDARLGAFSRLTIAWAAAAGNGAEAAPLPFAFETEFTCFTEAGLASFAQRYDAGTGAGVDVSTYAEGVPPPAGTFDNFNVSFAPTAHFPSFDAAPGSALSRAGFVEWAGEFAWHSSSWGVGVGSNATGSPGAGAAGFVGGQLGGPLVLHDSAAPRRAAAVLGAAGDFKSVMLALVGARGAAGARLVFGPQGHLAALPAGFAPTLLLAAPAGASSADGPASFFPGEAGVTAAVYSYGQALRLLHNTTRFAAEDDVGVSMLSVWTDNGAVYDGDFWDQAGKGGLAGDVYINMSAQLREMGVPAASLQLDPYWFARGFPGNGNWSASAEIWGADGFARMLAAGVRPTLYSFFWAAAGPARTFTQFRWVDGIADTFIKGVVARVAPEDSLAFHTELMRRCRLWDCVGFEVDFLDFIYFALPDALRGVGVHEAYLAGLSSAAVAAAVPVQLCMPLPSDVLASVALPGVSNIRASDDNDLTYAPAARWKIGLTSMLHGALGVRPFADCTWTYRMYAGADAADVPYPPGYAQNATELGVVVSALSTGPVGLGDKARFWNASLAAVACASNGVLLKPSLPASPVDAFFAVAPGQAPPTPVQAAGTEVWQAPSFVPITWGQAAWAAPNGAGAAAARARDPRGLHRFVEALAARDGGGTHAAVAAQLEDPMPVTTPCPFATLLIVDAPAALSLVVVPADLTPSLVAAAGLPGAGACAAAGLAAGGYVAVPWSPGAAAISARCADGARALDCAQVFGAGGLRVATGVAPNQAERGAPHPFELLSLAPVLGSGFALLGELGKAVRVAPVRFPAVAGAAAELSFLLAGAADEVVDVALLAPPPNGGGGLDAAAVRRLRVAFGPKGGLAQVRCGAAAPRAACNATGAEILG